VLVCHIDAADSLQYCGLHFCCVQLEDDIAIISSSLGWVPTTGGTSISSAKVLKGTAVTGTTSNAIADGVALPGTPSVYGFTATQGLATVFINGVTRG
jgi:hypothetical protein